MPDHSVIYRGFRIHPRKVIGKETYYATIYSVDGDTGFTIRKRDTTTTRQHAIKIAKRQIDRAVAAALPSASDEEGN